MLWHVNHFFFVDAVVHLHFTLDFQSTAVTDAIQKVAEEFGCQPVQGTEKFDVIPL